MEYLDGTINPPFQSTLSMRRATGNTAGNVRLIKFQSTLSMRRATVHAGGGRVLDAAISIHALHEESDSSCCNGSRSSTFQSTLSMRRATRLKQFRSLTAAQFQSTLSMRRATRRA